jgi:hypothetical protein
VRKEELRFTTERLADVVVEVREHQQVGVTRDSRLRSCSH